MRVHLPLLLALAGCAADVGFECLGDAPLCDIIDVIGEKRAPAGGLTITRVELNQAVAIPLMENGLAVDSDMPIIAGRPALVRVYVEPNDDWQARDISARFYIWDDNGDVAGAGQGDLRPSGASTDADLGSTFNIDLGPGMIQEGDFTWSVELVEGSPEARSQGNKRGSTFSEDKVATLTGSWAGPTTRVMIIPVEINGEVPSMGPDNVEAARKELFRHYPVPDIEILVGEPYPWPRPISGPGDQSSLLNALTAFREDELDIDPDIYVYGWHPGYGGGLAWLAGSPHGASQRVSVGGGIGGVMTHEVGHTHGRKHAPCPLPSEAGAPANQDGDYPHERASIGVWGYDLTSGTLFDPAVVTDYMSYCGPTWTSDYTWAALYQRRADMELIYSEGPTRQLTHSYTEVWLPEDGDAEWGRTSSYADPPEGEPVTVQVFDKKGRPLGEREAIRTWFTHGEGGVLLVPEGEPFASVQLRDRRLVPRQPGR